MEISAETFLQSFVKECRKRGMHILVARVVPPDEASPDGPRVPVQIMSTEDESKAAGLWNWLTKVDARAVTAAAEALYVATGNAAKTPWAEADDVTRQGFGALARVAFDAARAHAGRNLGPGLNPDKPLITS